jgi:ABC-type amino acid transport substrate-binding protein
MIARGADRSVDYLTPASRVLYLMLLAGLLFWLAPPMARALDAEPAQAPPLRIAVYDVPPYGYANPDGSMSGISVDLWRRIAERLERQFKLIPVAEMESILGGLERGRFDAQG